MSQIPVPAPSYFHQIPKHVKPLPDESVSPNRHYRRSANDSWNLLIYIERNLKHANVYSAPFERHMHRLYGMVLLSLVEAFERYLKEIAAVCVDNVSDAVVDDRLDVFTVKGHPLAAHFAEASVGKALCETSTWLDCDQINQRFRWILGPNGSPKTGTFYVFPHGNHNPASLRGKREIVALLFQLRHSIVHNAGVLTKSDAAKLSRLVKDRIEAPRLLWPTKSDVFCVKLFLDDFVETLNREIGTALSILLSDIYSSDQSVFDLPIRTQDLANAFSNPITIAGTTKNPK